MTNEADRPGVREFFKRLRAKLNQGPAWMTTDISELLPGRKIDAEILDDLETRLITADVGVEATSRILDELRKRVARKELNDVDALLKALNDGMSQILAPVEQALVIDPAAKPFVILVVGINGAGKTTTIGKLSARLLAEGKTVMLARRRAEGDRKSTRLNSSHANISYAVFCLKKKYTTTSHTVASDRSVSRRSATDST